jgi:hypothetical protein
MPASAKEKPIEAEMPVAISKYLDIDLRTDGIIAQNLLRDIDLEAQSDEIALSDIVGPQPANVTPQMETWYNTYIAGWRGQALHSICQLCKERGDPAKGESFILPLRLGSLDEDLLRKKRNCYQNNRDKFHTTSQNIAGLDSELTAKQILYNNRKSELGGREAEVTNTALYFFVMIFVLFASEAALNLESFEALPWATPAIAWGATIIIGVAIGFAAHFHGTVLKQYDYYFNAAEDDTKRGPAWRMMLGGSAALSVALALVYYARSAYLISYTSSLGSFGQTGSSPSFLWIVGGSLLGNILVYLTGTLWAYLMHDRDPQFVTWKVEIETTKKKLDGLKLQMETARNREIEQLTAKHKQKTEEAKQAYKQIAGQAALSWPLELFAKVQAKDNLVVAILANYRQTLVQKMGAHAKDVTFQAYSDDPLITNRDITVSGFTRNGVKLKYLEDA